MHDQEPINSTNEPQTQGNLGSGSKNIKRTSAGVIALALIAVLLFLPTNFVIRSPGPVFNTLGESDGTPLISIDGAKSYDSESTLDMLTVYVQGGGTSRVTIPILLQALADPTRDIVPEETVISRGTTSDQQSEENDFQMVNSQDQAIAAAFTELGYPFSTWLDVADFSTDTNSSVLLKGDRLLQFNGKDIKSLDELKSSLNENGDAPASLTVERVNAAGKTEKVDTQVATTVNDAGDRQLGVYLNTVHDFPIDVKFGLEDVGGPSAGMMFALAIIDRLTEGSLAGNHHIAGTGEITAEGAVGPIGGIAQKMVAAKQDGATIFLAPADNCAEVIGRVPAGLNVVKVSTLRQARSALEKIADGADPKTMETCS